MFNVRRNLPDFKVTKSENLAWRSCLQITFSYGKELGTITDQAVASTKINGLATLNTFEACKRKTEKLETKSKKLHRPAAAASTYCVMQLHDCVMAIQSHPRPDKAARPSIERRNSNLVRLPVVSSYCNRSVNLLTPGEQYEICILHSYIKRTYARLMIYNSAIHILPVEQHHSDLEDEEQSYTVVHVVEVMIMRSQYNFILNDRYVILTPLKTTTLVSVAIKGEDRQMVPATNTNFKT
uniref:Uncharacterized protein n=1 Tax=Glossina pallidipes TaxID=7398 RepID=A0A1B0AE68_GLOPL